MARLRYNGLTTTLGASLTSSATSVTFAAALTHSNGTNVPTLSGADYIPLAILDATGHLSEIVWLTAYTAASTTGTIARGKEGTTGVSHSSGDKVIQGPTAAEMSGWTPNLTLPLDSLTGFAAATAGTWSIISGVLNQSLTSSTEAILKWGTATQFAGGLNAVEVETRWNSGTGTQRMGFFIGYPASGSASGYSLVYVQGDGTNWTVREERYASALVLTSSSFTRSPGTWMRLSVMATLVGLNIYIDGALMGTVALGNAGPIDTVIALYSQGVNADFRNLKSWDSTLNPPSPF